MLTVTAQAAEELKTKAEAEIADPNQAFRLIHARSGGIALVVDRVRGEDQVVEHEGVNILLVGAELADTVDGLVLDAKETPEGRRLVISGRAPET